MKRLRSFLLSGVLLLCTLAILEGLLRIVPSPVQFPSAHDDGESLVGLELIPGAREFQRNSCASWLMAVNENGWRDIERSVSRVSGKVRIAVIGDSFTEGAGVQNEEMFTRHMESLLGNDVEVLNFGLSSTGTVQHEILYEHVVAAYKPDIVIIAFYMNDIANSHPVLEGGPNRDTRLTYRAEDGSLVSYKSPEAPGADVRRFLRRHSALFRLLKTNHRLLRSFLRPPPPSPSNQESYPNHYFAFGEPQTPEWREAWENIEQSFLRMKSHMQENQRFYFFIIPGLIEVADDPEELFRKEFGEPTPPGFDIAYVRNRLQAFARDNDIGTLDLFPGFRQYIEEHELGYPYFSRVCDGHWSPLGHEVAAEILAGQLKSVVNEYR